MPTILNKAFKKQGVRVRKRLNWHMIGKIIKFRLPYRAGNFLTRSATTASCRTVHRKVVGGRKVVCTL